MCVLGQRTNIFSLGVSTRLSKMAAKLFAFVLTLSMVTLMEAATIKQEEELPPSDVEIHPGNGENGFVVVKVGDELTCTAKRTPPVTFEWKNLEHNIWAPGQKVKIKEEWVALGRITLNCLVNKIINNLIYFATNSVDIIVEE